MVLLDTVSKLDLETLVWILNHVPRSIRVSVHSKSIKLTCSNDNTFNVIFQVVVLVYLWLKFETRLSSLHNISDWP